MTYFTDMIKTNENGELRSKNTIQTYGYDWKNAIKFFFPNQDKKKIDVNDISNFKIINKSLNEIMSKINELPIKKRKRILNIIIVLKKALKDLDEIDEMREELKKINLEIMGVEELNVKSEKQKKNWIEIQEYEALVSRLEQNVKDIFKQDNIGAKSRDKIQEYIILKFYQLYHLRNDLAELIIIKNKDYIKLPKDEEKENNYLIIDGRARKVILNNYKTKKQYKKVQITLDKELARVIRKYLKLNNTGYLLINQSEVPLTRNTFSIYFRRMMKKYTDKNVGSSLLRHIFISEKTKGMKTVAERRELADKMLHSVSTQSLYHKN